MRKIYSTRIKTNGSLPRDRRPQDFNGQILKAPSSPGNEFGSMFSFESTFSNNPGECLLKRSTFSIIHKDQNVTTFLTGFSPQNTLVHQRLLADRSPYENFPLFRGSQRPRTQIRTILPPVSTDSPDGAGEDLFSNYKSKEQLYIEARNVLNHVEP